MSVLLLHGGLVVDGSGTPAQVGDVLLVDERIAAQGQDVAAAIAALPHGERAALERVDCRGKVVAPGFIDVHSHDDAAVVQMPQCLPKLSQGVTTVVAGNCGISLAPWRTAAPPPPLNLLGQDSFRFDSFADYTRELNRVTPSVNVAALVGHTTLRFACMPDVMRPASADELAQMDARLEQALAQGAIGLSTGLYYEQAFQAPMQEVQQLAHTAAGVGGVYATHMRSETDDILPAMQEAADTARAAGVHLVISHHKCAGHRNWGRSRETLPFYDQLRRQQSMGMDVYPYVAGSTILREDMLDGHMRVLITWSKPHPDLAGRWLDDLAKLWGVDEREACTRLQPGGGCYFLMAEEDVMRILQHEDTMIGSDGLPHDQHPHPRLWGAFPRVLGHYWRQLRLFSLEQAIYKMTGLSARNFRLHQRGLLRAGYFADVVVLDPETVQDMSTFEAPTQCARGIERVYVNGQLSYDGAEQQVVARAGRWLPRAA